MSENKAASTVDAGEKPWLSWPHELPSTREFRDFPDAKMLTDHVIHREMAQEQRDRVFAAWTATTKDSAVLLKGGSEEAFELYESDCLQCEFRQEANFRYLFAINEPDCFGLLDLTRKESVLFVPYIDDDAERWNGERRPLEWYTERYGVTQTMYTRDLAKELTARGITTVHTPYGRNLDSGNYTKTTVDLAALGLAETVKEDRSLLYPLLCQLRSIKSKREINFMRVACRVTCQAHVYVMRHIKAGMSELQCEALFKAWCCYFGASRHTAYTCICGSGAHGAILHYGHAARPNDRILRDGDNMVLDMGGEFVGYATDITRSYPVNGKFTAQQRMVHDAVFAAQQAVFAQLKPGVSYPDMHRLAERVIIEHLIKAGILHGGTVDEMMKVHVGAVFMPHGLGHMIGLYTHDVGGYEEDVKRSTEPGLCWLRLGRKMEAGMVITVEPGLYFNDSVLNSALADAPRAKFINKEVLAKYRGMGGVRLEDDVLITETGYENFTILPTSADEIEEVIAQVKSA